MQDYIRKLVVRQWCTEMLRTLFAIERAEGHGTPECVRRKDAALNATKDKLETALVRGQVSAYEYYVIIGYIDEYAFGNHFEDLPGI